MLKKGVDSYSKEAMEGTVGLTGYQEVMRSMSFQSAYFYMYHMCMAHNESVTLNLEARNKQPVPGSDGNGRGGNPTGMPGAATFTLG